jgi:hypothetical protein
VAAAAPPVAAPPAQATPVPTEEPAPPATPAPTPPPLAAGTGRIVVIVEREGVDATVRVSLTPGGQPAVTLPVESSTATFDSLRPGSYTVSIAEFGCRRAVTVEAGSNAVVRLNLAPNPSTGGFRCTIAGN